MVELKLTGKCSGCQLFDANVEKLYSNGKCVETIVVCANQEMCDRIERKFKEALKNGKEEV